MCHSSVLKRFGQFLSRFCLDGGILILEVSLGFWPTRHGTLNIDSHSSDCSSVSILDNLKDAPDVEVTFNFFSGSFKQRIGFRFICVMNGDAQFAVRFAQRRHLVSLVRR